MKKFFLFTVMFFWIGCCAPLDNWFISEGELFLRSGNAVLSGAIEDVDVLTVQYSASLDFVQSPDNNFFNFGPTLMAFQCDHGDEGISDPIESFEIVSNRLYGGVTAGQSLNHLFIAPNSSFVEGFNELENFSIAEMIVLINDKNSGWPWQPDGSSQSTWTLETAQKPENSEEHIFTATIVTASGNEIVAVSPSFTWE